jgi:GDP-L-fucose synthase
VEHDARIFVAGHRGLVGSGIVRALKARGYTSVLTRARSELDLCDARATLAFFEAERPAYVFMAAAKVGGILANSTYPADFIRDNLLIQCSVIEACQRTSVERLLFLGSTCIYPKLAPQPLREEYLLTGPLEPTNEAYAVAKIAGISMVNAYRKQYGLRGFSVMPTNLYGPGDYFSPDNSHVIPALMRRFHEAKLAGVKEVSVWGSGTPRREFLHVDDLAEACLYLMDRDDVPDLINVGVGHDVTVRELAETLRDVVGLKAELIFDASKPDGTPRKLVDVTRLSALGFTARIGLHAGLTDTYRWYVENSAEVRA